MNHAFRLISIVTLLFLLTLPSAVYAQNQSFENPTYDVGFSLGVWFSDDVYLGMPNDYYEKDTSLLLRVFADYYLMPTFATGAYINVSSVNFDYFDIEGSMVEIGAAFKPRFVLAPDLAIKPGLNIGYRSVSSDTKTAEHDGLGVNLSVEIQYQPEMLRTNGLYAFFETGFLSQPTGGNPDQEISFAPIMYTSIGIGF